AATTRGAAGIDGGEGERVPCAPGRSARAADVPRGAAPALRRQPHRQGFQLVEEGRLDEDRVAGELHLGGAGEGLLEEDLQLEAGEGGAEAEVAAARAEGLMVGVAEDVEAIGVLVARLVAV